MACRIAAIPMTLSDRQGHSHVAAVLNAIFRTIVQRLTGFQLI